MANPTADALTARAKVLRDEYVRANAELIATVNREVDVALRGAKAAQARVEELQKDLPQQAESLRNIQKTVRARELEAAEADRKGLPQEEYSLPPLEEPDADVELDGAGGYDSAEA